MKALLLLSVVAAASVAETLDAQVKQARPDSGCTTSSDGRKVECHYFRGQGDSTARDIRVRVPMFYKMDSAMAKRAALGLELRTTGTKRDTLGVFVEAVTPKGPAEAAGIIEGDRIAAINGVDLRTSAGDTEDSYAAGLAAHRLTREVQKLTPGTKVNLRIYSGGRFRDVQVTTGKASDVMRSNRFGLMMPRMDGMEFDGSGLEFEGPGMEFGPDVQMMRMEPFMKERIEPMLRERMRDTPSRIQLRSPIRIRTIAPMRRTRTFRVDAGAIEPMSADEIRALAAITIRDARSALKKLAADGLV